ncbi:hypothetical protein ACFLZV_02345 [Candidatus Margulisiibacteriota bacterium]
MDLIKCLSCKVKFILGNILFILFLLFPAYSFAEDAVFLEEIYEEDNYKVVTQATKRKIVLQKDHPYEKRITRYRSSKKLKPKTVTRNMTFQEMARKLRLKKKALKATE